ncbi:MAG: antA/AntB antirepressor family protein, partial [Ruminococcus flavefaciens]|nr:antA/AntB antirepressor family protein [Ruminococcus flavefaciens]
MNNELIKINYESENPTVSGRELHEALGVKTAYKDWFPRMCEYGFEEGKDFNPLKNERVQFEGSRQVVREVTDHQLTIPMAKEICMLQRNENGKMFRQYFIAVENQWNTPEAVMARALKLADKNIEALKQTNNALLKQAAEDKPKVIFADAVATAKTSILIGDLAKLIKQNGVDIGQKRLFDWMRTNGYLIKSGSSRNMPTQRSMDLG